MTIPARIKTFGLCFVVVRIASYTNDFSMGFILFYFLWPLISIWVRLVAVGRNTGDADDPGYVDVQGSNEGSHAILAAPEKEAV